MDSYSVSIVNEFDEAWFVRKKKFEWWATTIIELNAFLCSYISKMKKTGANDDQIVIRIVYGILKFFQSSNFSTHQYLEKLCFIIQNVQCWQYDAQKWIVPIDFDINFCCVFTFLFEVQHTQMTLGRQDFSNRLSHYNDFW